MALQRVLGKNIKSQLCVFLPLQFLQLGRHTVVEECLLALRVFVSRTIDYLFGFA